MQGKWQPFALQTQRLTLRPYEISDIDDVFEYARDCEFGRFLPVPIPYARSDAEEYVARQVQTDWSRAAAFAIALADRAAGGVDLQINAVAQNAKLGFALARRHWGKGLAAEAAGAVVGFGFERYGLHKVFARADVRNRRSWRVLEKLGMTREGLLRSHVMVRNQPGDIYCYGILRPEWESSR